MRVCGWRSTHDYWWWRWWSCSFRYSLRKATQAHGAKELKGHTWRQEQELFRAWKASQSVDDATRDVQFAVCDASTWFASFCRERSALEIRRRTAEHRHNRKVDVNRPLLVSVLWLTLIISSVSLSAFFIRQLGSYVHCTGIHSFFREFSWLYLTRIFPCFSHPIWKHTAMLYIHVWSLYPCGVK